MPPACADVLKDDDKIKRNSSSLTVRRGQRRARRGPTRHGLDEARSFRVYRKLAQNRWMRLHASSRTSVEVAYEIRKNGLSPNAAPNTTATPSSPSSSDANTSSVSMTLPDGAVLPIRALIEGYT